MRISWWPERSVVVELDMVVYRRLQGSPMLWPPRQKVLKELATMQILELAIAADKKVCCWSLEQITISLTIKNAIIMPDSRFPLDLVPTTKSVYSSTYWPFYQKAPFFRHVGLPLLFTPAIQNGYTGRPNRRLYLIRKTELGDHLVVRYEIRWTYTNQK